MSNRQLGCGAAYDTDRKKMKEREREKAEIRTEGDGKKWFQFFM